MHLVLVALLFVPVATAQPPPPENPGDLICITETQPEMLGGLEALQAAVVYPPDARAEGVEGQVIVQFVVQADGAVTDPVVLRSPDDRLSAAALDAVSHMTFTPGRQRGQPVAVRFAVPVRFRLD